MPYTPGTLECRGYDANGARINAATHTIKTAGAPAALQIEVEQGASSIIANSDDVADQGECCGWRWQLLPDLIGQGRQLRTDWPGTAH